MENNTSITFFMVHFDQDRKNDYNILSKIFQKSIEKHMPDATVINKKLELKELPNLKKISRSHRYYTSYRCNTLKLKYWNEYIRDNNQNTVLIDCDMLLRKSIHDIFDHNFDIGITLRGESFRSLNGGVIFIKPNENVKDFFEKWYNKNNYLLENPKKLEYYSKIYRQGINQSSLCLLLDEERDKYNIKYFPCTEWNCCQDSWNKIYDVNNRIVHVKSSLRRELLKVYKRKKQINKIETKYLQPIIQEWMNYLEE